MRKNLFVLVDASTEIGSGHILRCLTLSQELKNKFSKIIFLTSNNSKPILENIKPISIEIIEHTVVLGEVDNITAVAGVCGAEAEDEALHHLYYRQSMKGPSKVELNKALGKLLNTLGALKDKNPEHAKIPEVTHYVIQIYKKLEDNSKAKEY